MRNGKREVGMLTAKQQERVWLDLRESETNRVLGFGLTMPLHSLPKTWPGHLPVPSVVKETWPSSFSYFPYLTCRRALDPPTSLGCFKAQTLLCCLCSEHLRVIKWPLLPRAEQTSSKIILSWNILLNWNVWQLSNHCSHLNKSICFSWNVFHAPHLDHAKGTGRPSCLAEADCAEIVILFAQHKVKGCGKSRVTLIDL